MTAKECIMTRRSIRQFSDKPVDEAILRDIIETASFSPSWKNTQITRYVAVKGDLKDKIAKECCIRLFNSLSAIYQYLIFAYK